jgi:hypothetical protein
VVGCGGAAPNEGMSVIGLGRADLAEQGQCLLPVEQRGVRGLWVERMAEDQQGVGLAEAVTGVALDRQGLAGELDGPMALVLRELDAGESGQRLAFEEPESGLTSEGERLVGDHQRLIVATGALVGGSQPDERDDLGIAALGGAGELQGLPVAVSGLRERPAVEVDAGQRVEGVGLEATLTGVTGQGRGRGSELERLAEAAGVASDPGQGAKGVGFATSVTDLALDGQGGVGVVDGTVEPA